jgi:uncharacterized membrane protein
MSKKSVTRMTLLGVLWVPVLLQEARGELTHDAGESIARTERVTVEVLEQPGLLAQDSDGASKVIVGQSVPDGTFRWTRAGGAERISDTFSTRTSVSNSGASIAGAILASDDLGNLQQRAALWTTADGWQPIGPVYKFGSQATSVSSNGRFVIGYGGDGTRLSVPFIWSTSFGAVELPLPAAPPGFLEHPGAEPRAVSANGNTVVGLMWHVLAGEFFLRPRGVRWVNGSPQLLEDDGGVALGAALACNSDCSVIAGGATISPASDNSHKAYRWTHADGARYLGVLAHEPQASGSYVALDVTEDGRKVVGIYQYLDEEQLQLVFEGVLWNENGVARGFRECLRSLGSRALDDWLSIALTDISNDGTRIVGWGRDRRGTYRSFIARFGEQC